MNSINPCTKIIAKEFWLDDKLSDSCCILYLVFKNGDCVVGSYNDEICMWELVGANDCPDFDKPEGDKSFYYPFRDHTPKGVTNIGDMTKHMVKNRNLLTINFGSGIKVSALYDTTTESGQIEIAV